MRVLTVAAIVLVSLGVQAQSSLSQATFEVASIKPSATGTGPARVSSTPGQFTAVNVTVRQLLQEAYDLHPLQIVGGPDWADRERFDVIAKAADASDVHRGRLIALLADRFRLKARRETRELEVYALVRLHEDDAGTSRSVRLQPDAPQLEPVTVDCEALQKSGAPRPPLSERKGPLCGALVAPFRISSGGITMATLAETLSHSVGRLVIDRTNLPGRYAFELEHAPDPLGRGDVGPADGPSLFTALQEQLGLRLQSTRALVDVLVIDAVDRPTPD